MAGINIASYVGATIKVNHTYFNAWGISDIVLPDGKVVRRNNDGELIYEGIDDSNGIAFYLRLEAEEEFNADRRTSSTTTRYLGKTRVHLIAYAFGDKNINPHNWASSLANLIRQIPFNNYSGPGQDISIVIRKTNANCIDVALQELREAGKITQDFICVEVEFEINYATTSTCAVCNDIGDLCTNDSAPVIPCNCPESGGGGGVDCDTIAECPVIVQIVSDIETLQAADVTLQNNIDDVQSEVDAEEIARANADTALQNQITQEVTDRQAGDAATLASSQTYTDNVAVGMLNDRGNHDASTNVFPANGGSGAGGAIRRGNVWFISVGGNLGGEVVTIGDVIRALVDNPGQVAANWSIMQVNITFVPENQANKDIDSTFAANSDIKYPSQKAVKTAIDALKIERRNDFVSPYNYCGKAPDGSLDNQSVWTITRIELTGAGTDVKHAIGVKWTDRLTEIYS